MIPRIGKYTIEKELGHGGFGDVFLAFDPDVGHRVAIKHLRVELGTDPDMLKRFQYEIRTTAGLRHPNIVAIFASEVENGNPYLVMEYLEGKTLKDIIQTQQPLTLLEKVSIMTQAAEGLAYAHSKGIVHRDVKPENIMLLPDQSVKIMDFGIALAADRNTVMTETGGIIGTPPYFAPEQLQGYKANEQTDIFSLGDVYYELVTGQHPFERFKHDWKALQMAILSFDPPAVSQLAPGCPEALELLVHRMIAKECEFRYATFEELLLDSKSILVDLQHDRAAALLREVPTLVEAGDLHGALGKLREAQQLEPGNREVRHLRDTITQKLQKSQVQGRVAELLAEARAFIRERRFGEAVQSLESAARLDSSNVDVHVLLGEAKSKLDSSVRASRLVSEARFKQQKGQLTEALERLTAAIAIDPEHTEALALHPRVRELVERRQREDRLRHAMQTASGHLSAKRFGEALAALAQIEQEQPEAAGVAELRLRIEQAKADEERRIRAERFNLAVSRTREAIQAGELDRAGQMLDHLFANFNAEPGAGVLPALREQLNAQVRARDFAAGLERLLQAVRELLASGKYSEAIDRMVRAPEYSGEAEVQAFLESARASEAIVEQHRVVAAAQAAADRLHSRGDSTAALSAVEEALSRYPEDPWLTQTADRLRDQIERARRVAAIERHRTSIVREIEDGAWETAESELLKARAEFPDESAFDDLAAQVEIGLFHARLEELVFRVREALAAGKLSEASQQIEATRAVFARDAEWKALDEEVAKRKEYEAALVEAERHRKQGDLAQAETLLTTVIREGAGDQRATQIVRAIQAERLEAARQAELQRQAEITAAADRVRVHLRADEIREAVSVLIAARVKYPGEGVWKILESEINSRQAELKRQAEIEAREAAAKRQAEIEAREAAAKRQAEIEAREAAAKRQVEIEAREAAAKRQAEIDAREAAAKRQAEIDAREAAAKRQAEIEAREAAAKRQAEIDAREAAAKRQAEVEAREAAAKRQAEIDAREAAAKRQAEIEAREAAAKRQAEIEARGAAAKRQAEIDAREAAAKRQSEIEARGAAAKRQAEIEAREAAAKRQAEIEAREAAKRQAEIEAIAVIVRNHLMRDEFRQAVQGLTAARAKYPGNSLWPTLEAEIRARHAAVEAAEQQRVQRVREQETAAIASRIPAVLPAAQEASGTGSPLPWKWIGGGVAAALVLAGIVAAPHLFPKKAITPSVVAAIPVEIRTDPPGASVRVGDRSCVTPNCRFDLKPGEYEVQAELKDYEPKQQHAVFDASNRMVDLALKPLPPPPTPPGQPAPATGTLTVIAALPNALIYIDGRALDRTDQSGSKDLPLEAKTHEVRVELPGYEKPPAQQVTLTAGARKTARFQLSPLTARLELRGAPGGVEVLVAGLRLGRTDGSAVYPFPAPVKAGDQAVQVTLGPGSRTVRRRFEPGQTLILDWKDVEPAKTVSPPLPPPVVPPPTLTKEEIESQDWNRVDPSDPSQLRAFLRNHPSGAHAKTAESALETRTWSDTNKSNVASLRSYLGEYASGAHASEANKLIAELIWNVLDKSKPDEIRKFLSENAGSPHKAEAQKILDQLLAEQRLKQEVLDALKQFDSALQHKQKRGLSAIWPGIPPPFRDALDTESMSLVPKGEVKILEGDQASVRCDLVTTIRRDPSKHQAMIAIWRNSGGKWTIESLTVEKQ